MNHDITLPSKPKIISEEGNRGTYEIDDLYAGYGHTLGNSLRRIILSSLPGAAATKVKIHGAPHEFSTIEGIQEDVITIILNLKKVKFKIHANEPQTASISIKGKNAKEVTAKDFRVPAQMEVLNPDQHIATLTDKNASLEMEITVEKGLGYVSRENLHKDKVEIGAIILDAAFSPVKRVNYEVENMRVGDKTDYNKLRFFIETNGDISPREALEKSIDIMIRHLKAIVGFQEENENAEIGEGSLEEIKKEISGNEQKHETSNAEALKMKLDDLQFSSRTLNVLSEAGVRTLGGLSKKKETDLMQIEGVGKKTIQEVRRALSNYGLILK